LHAIKENAWWRFKSFVEDVLDTSWKKDTIDTELPVLLPPRRRLCYQ
jgi:hypothetical protein